MGYFQIFPAIHQWARAQKVFNVCFDNMNVFYSYFNANKFHTVDLQSQGVKSVTPRVSIFVNDREKIKEYFYNNKVELGQWFDGPLSPVPDNDVFNYTKNGYPHAQLCANTIVNFPCHSRITRRDINRMISLIDTFQQLYPEVIKKQI